MSGHRRSPWRLAGFAVLGVLAARVIWVAAAFYLGGAPRFPLESAVIALVIVGTIIVLLSGDDREAHEPEDRAFSAGSLAAFIAASFIVFAPALGLGLLSDDYALRARADLFTSTPFFRPIPLILWRLLLAVRDSAVVLHAANVALHGLNAFLVAELGRRLGLHRDAALAAGALFVTFPAAPEAVAWCSGIQDVLLTTCALGAVIAGQGLRAGSTGVAAGLLLVALGTKETAVCIPVLMALCWFSPLSARQRHAYRAIAALFAIVVIYGLVRLYIGVDERYAAEPSRYLVKQLLAHAFGTLAAPWRSTVSTATRWLTLATSVALTAVLLHAFFRWRRTDPSFHRAIRLALWVIAAVGPVFTLFFVETTLEGARYVYLAQCGWALLVADLLSMAARRMPRPTVTFACMATLAVAISVVMLERELRVWARAALERDRVLAEARQSAAAAGCTTARFDRVPESVDGAYVFRNGFPEAMRESGIAVADTAPACDFRWSGHTFVRVAR